LSAKCLAFFTGTIHARIQVMCPGTHGPIQEAAGFGHLTWGLHAAGQ
jgi:hypothetical protein